MPLYSVLYSKPYMLRHFGPRMHLHLTYFTAGKTFLVLTNLYKTAQRAKGSLPFLTQLHLSEAFIAVSSCSNFSGRLQMTEEKLLYCSLYS